MSDYLYCPKELHFKHLAVCLYTCPMRRKIRCASYDEVYDKLVETGQPLAQIYVEKYGIPELPAPYSRRVRRKSKSPYKPIKRKKRSNK